jgi:hypothetical protein
MCTKAADIAVSSAWSPMHVAKPLLSNLWSCSELEQGQISMAGNALAIKIEKASKQDEIRQLRERINCRRRQLESSSTSTSSGMHTPLSVVTSAPCSPPPTSLRGRSPEMTDASLLKTQALMQQLREVRRAQDTPGKVAEASGLVAAPASAVAPGLALPKPAEAPGHALAARASARCSGPAGKGNGKGRAAVSASNGDDHDHDHDDNDGNLSRNDKEPALDTNKRKHGGRTVKYEDVADMDEKCLLARLQRLCETKPSGKCRVSAEVSALWKSYDIKQRMGLARILAAGDFSDSKFDSRITITYLRKHEKTTRTIKGYFTAHQLKEELKYDPAYIKQIVKFCTKEKLYRRTKYCSKTNEYWVEHSARHESLDSEVQQHRLEDTKQAETEGVSGVSFQLQPMPASVPDDIANSESGDEGEADEDEAVPRRGKATRKGKRRDQNRNRNRDGKPQSADETLEDVL